MAKTQQVTRRLSLQRTQLTLTSPRLIYPKPRLSQLTPKTKLPVTLSLPTKQEPWPIPAVALPGQPALLLAVIPLLSTLSRREHIPFVP